MTKLLEIRESLRNLYGRTEIYIRAGVKFLISLIALLVINDTMGYMSQINKIPVVLMLALLCTFLPINMVSVLLSVFILLHLSALSLEVCVVALCILLLMVFMYFRMAPDNGYNAVLTPLLFYFKIPQVMPVSIGLLKEPFSIVSMACGIVWFYFLKGVISNESLFSTAIDADDKTSKFVLALQQITENKEMFLAVAAFAITALIVYLIRRQSINRSWTVAICVGNVLNLVIMLVGHFVLGTTSDLLWLIIGMLLSFAYNFCVEFFMYSFDYSRIEKVQFEDDEYYYFVKAIPKSYLSTKVKQVKKINSNKKMTINRKKLAEEFDIDEEFLDD